MATFDSPKRSLPELLAEITRGGIQLPDFQRGWVWDDDHVRSLLVSIARSFPVGAVMLLQTGGEARFQVRPVEGVELPTGGREADFLILDGQQRLTTLTQALALTTPVATRTSKGKAIKRHYYFDIELALEGEDRLDEALIGVDQSRTLTTDFGRHVALDLSSRALECQQLYFPCDQILNSDAWEESLHEHAPEQWGDYMAFRKQILNAFRSYQVPIIELKKETSKEAVCLVFEKVNTGGVPLSVFELVTATYAADGYNLRDDWFGSDDRNVDARRDRLTKEPILEVLEATDFLQAITMLHTRERRQADIAAGKTGKQVAPVSAKRAAVLELPLDAYRAWADPVEKGFRLAAKFLRKECFWTTRDLPYRTQLAPLAAVLAVLEERWLEPRIYDKLAQWYWCGVLGELYGGAVETRMANDVEELLAWIDGSDQAPRTVGDAAFQPDRLDTLATRQSAAYKGMSVLVLREGARDFFWKAGIQELDAEEVALDIHHIFPQDWCQRQGIPRKVYNSVINKTPISYKANRMIGGSAPSAYLRKIQAHMQVKIDDAAMDDILDSHRINAEHLRSDDFESFMADRKLALLALIHKAMGKEILEDDPASAEQDRQAQGNRDAARTPRGTGPDFTRYDLVLDGARHSNLPKRTTIYQVCRHLVEAGVHPDRIRDLITWRRNKVWASTAGTLDADEFQQHMAAEGDPDRPFRPKRWFSMEGDLLHHDGRTWAFSNQWGTRWSEAMDLLIQAFPEHQIAYESTGETNDSDASEAMAATGE